jgi:hypothetical protein
LAALDDVAHLRDLAGRDRDPRLPGAFGEPLCDLDENLRVESLDRQIVDHGDRLGADAEEVVHVHRDAIDSDRVVAAHHLRDQHLGAGAVRGDGEPGLVRQADHVGEVTEREPDVADAPGRTMGKSLLELPDEETESGLLLLGIDADLRVVHGPPPGARVA